jgi:outer membrane scaffolding protein for murein synthesis (MipA/OmpV family)
MTSYAMETAIITKTDSGYELSDTAGDRIHIYQSWELIAEMCRNSDYSEEYIDRRKTEVDAGGKAKIDETNE